MRLIDADALIEIFDKDKYDRIRNEYQSGFNDGMLHAEVVADNQPTVDAVPVRHGKFIGTEYDGYADGNPVYYEWKCSECGCIFEDDEPTYRYCPNCGARMVEDE